ncbi:pentapeptide repeat-containing protein [Streptomyces sp. R21]|uniref:Pentapeptide repeat-containing protein n=1 Tax=Streptomyces sp. R21 TaxID=3238627 RepID=A0AB39NZH2_9ACTN
MCTRSKVPSSLSRRGTSLPSSICWARNAYTCATVTFTGATFSGATVTFRGAEFSGGNVSFLDALFTSTAFEWGPLPVPAGA